MQEKRERFDLKQIEIIGENALFIILWGCYAYLWFSRDFFSWLSYDPSRPYLFHHILDGAIISFVATLVTVVVLMIF
ncbi:MAG: hypothetical protein UX07_C0001G0015 [Parcubacteria group bacterium GW2011_GWA2_45_30]|nr:MAG: hypothetical protein UX07_C0001G0015 [Parcubacteria group bacterium GW2011_GWA2_45_30]